MEPITSDTLRALLRRLGERSPGPGTFYLLGGSALCLLGNPRTTLDVDYMFEVEVGSTEQFQAVLEELAVQMHLDVEAVPLGEFIPLPPQAYARRRPVARFGQLDVYIFDLYSIALSKIARGFESDLEDVEFMLRDGLVVFEELERLFLAILPAAPQADIIPDEFRAFFEQVRRGARTRRTD